MTADLSNTPKDPDVTIEASAVPKGSLVEQTRDMVDHVLDKNWYERMSRWGSFNAFAYLDGKKEYRDQQMSQFLKGEVRNPVLDYPKIDRDHLERYEAELMNLKKDILEQEKNETVRQAYRWKINEKLAELRMLRQTEVVKKTMGNPEGEKEERQKAMRRFRRYNEFIYGDPSPEIFRFTLRGLQEELRPYLIGNPAGNSIESVAKDLSGILRAESPASEKESELSLPADQSVEKAGGHVERELSHLLESVPKDKKEFGPDEIKTIFEDVLRKMNLDDWKVVIDPNRPVFAVVNEEKEVKIPAETRTMHRLMELIIHELGTHALRFANGKRSRLMLLGLGLDRYEMGDEGSATLREQAFNRKVENFANLERHLAISLALKGKDFRSVFEVMRKYFLFKALQKKKSFEQASKEANDEAWKLCVRVFRGTDCETKGVCYTKDMVYSEGNVAVWDFIGKNQEDMSKLSIGQLNPANPRHLWILSQLGISDQDLGTLQR